MIEMGLMVYIIDKNWFDLRSDHVGLSLFVRSDLSGETRSNFEAF